MPPLPATIDLCVFSGTGNTLLAAQRLAAELADHGRRVTLHHLERTDPAALDADCLGLAFPVAAQTTYPLVWDFCWRLPDRWGKPVFMLDTLASYSGGIVGPLRDTLLAKGYQPLGAREIPMPINILRRRPADARDQRVIQRGLALTAAYAGELIAGTATWPTNHIGQSLMYAMGGHPWVWASFRWLGRRFRIDRDRCIRCGRCAHICPTGTIGLYDDRPFMGSGCQQCGRCIAFCPTGAISYPLLPTIPYRACNWSDFAKI